MAVRKRNTSARAGRGGAVPKFRAQLATLVEKAPEGDEWLHELKYDGYRIGCSIDNGRVELESRRGNDWTSQFPEVTRAAGELDVDSALLDGEVAIVLPNGKTSFQALQNVFGGGKRSGLTYFVFDLLYLDGRDLASLPLEERKELLRDLLKDAGDESLLKYSEHFVGNGPSILKRACEIGAEGIVSKRRSQPYRPGRNEGWLKTKCVLRQEFVIGGFTDPEGSRTGIGSLLIGYHDRGELKFAGKVGTGRGFTSAYTARIRKDLDAIERDECPFDPRPPGWLGRNAHWVDPIRVGEVVFTEWTEGGSIRHGSFQGFRDDKKAKEVVRETPAAVTKGSTHARAVASRVAGVVITTPTRPVYAKIAFTKLDLAKYYEDIAPWMLPYIAGRPLTLVRCEKGVKNANALRTECNFLRHGSAWHRWAADDIRRVQIKEQKKVGEYLVVDSVQALVGIAQGDIVEIHCWNATADRLEHPDRLVFDLDPGSDVKWRHVVEAALQLRERLENVGLESWAKLTGGKGIHVVVPCAPVVTWDEAYAFSRAVVESLVRDDPASFTTAFSKSGRTNKILLDYKRNHRAAVAVAAYSTRARPNGPVSMPLRWEELVPDLASDAFTVENFRERMAAIKQPWEGFFDCRQSLRATRRSAKARRKPSRSARRKGASRRISTRNAREIR